MTEQTQITSDWRAELEKSQKEAQQPQLKIKDKEIVKGVFKGEGEKKPTKFGDKIIFTFLKDNEAEVRIWYVPVNNFDLLNQIRALGKITDLKVEIRRFGSGKTDTRYVVTKI